MAGRGEVEVARVAFSGCRDLSGEAAFPAKLAAQRRSTFQTSLLRFLRPSTPKRHPSNSPLTFFYRAHHVCRCPPHVDRFRQARCHKTDGRGRGPSKDVWRLALLTIRLCRCRVLLRHPRRLHARRCVRPLASLRCLREPQWLPRRMRDSCDDAITRAPS